MYTTEATADLCDIMLRDSAHIQMMEAEWRTKKNRRGREAGSHFRPTRMEDALGLIQHLAGCPYNKVITLEEGIKVRFVDVGHLLGSASIEIWLTEGETEKKIVFSGDIGNLNQPLIKDPSYVEEADYVVMESTYGNREHEAPPDYVKALAEVIERTLSRGGNLVIPSFAVGRTPGNALLYPSDQGGPAGIL